MRPAILIGNGCRGNPELVEFLCSTNMPVLTTWQALDLVPEDNPAFCGRPGVIGQRAANIIIQKCDDLRVFGARLDMETVGHNLPGFASNAKLKQYVDADLWECAKMGAEGWTVTATDLSQWTPPYENVYHLDGSWLAWCKELYRRFRPELDYQDSIGLDPYTFVHALSDVAPSDALIVCGSSGMQSCAMMQAFKVKRGQRVLICNTIGAMGLEPMAVGAAVQSGKQVIVVTGDGGFAQNVQELEVVRRLNLPIKYFIFANGGYGSIAVMQDARFGLRVGSDGSSGFTLPNLYSVAHCFGLGYSFIETNSDCELIGAFLDLPGPSIIEVQSPLSFRYACKVQSEMVNGELVPDRFEDMTPKIPDLEEIMKW